MIKITKPSRYPTEYPQDLLSDEIKQKIKDILDPKIPDSKKDFKSYRTSDVVTTLYSIYHQKCGYCESKLENPRMGSLPIDHYRPKEGKYGYYWLTYEWTNLVLACWKCNTSKSIKFPLYDDRGKRIKTHIDFLNQHGELNWMKTRTDSDLLLEEEPLFLNPEIDNPDDFIKFSNDGQVRGIDPKMRGRTTITGLDLNDGDIIKSRKKIIDNYVLSFNEKLDRIEEKIKSGKITEVNNGIIGIVFSELFDEIQNGAKPENEFSRFRKCIYDDFENFIISYLPDTIKDQMRNYFNEFKAGTL